MTATLFCSAQYLSKCCRMEPHGILFRISIKIFSPNTDWWQKVLPFLPFPPLDYVNTAALFVKIEIFPSYSVVSLYNISCKLKINNHIHSLCSYWSEDVLGLRSSWVRCNASSYKNKLSHSQQIHFKRIWEGADRFTLFLSHLPFQTVFETQSDWILR